MNDSAWPLYVRLCGLQRQPANRFAFVLWITARTRPHLNTYVHVEQMKAAVLASIHKEVATAEAASRAVANLTLLAAE